MEEYPYYILPYLEEYRQVDPNSERGKKLARLLSLNIGDRTVLRDLLGTEPPEMDKICEEEPKAPSSFDRIDAFLEKYQVTSAENRVPSDKCQVTSAKDQVNPTTDNRQPTTDHTASESRHSELKELVRNHRYQEAIDFIESQNLINPKKNIYFADQIRFLKKLIDLEKQKNK